MTDTGRYRPLAGREAEGWEDYRLLVMSRLDKQDTVLVGMDGKLTQILIEQAAAKEHARDIAELHKRVGELEKFKERASVWMGLIAVIGTGTGGIVGTAVTHMLLRGGH